MKKNVSNVIRLLPLILILVIVSTGCNRRGRLQTVLPGRTSTVGDEGPVGQTARNGQSTRTGSPTDFNVNPIGNNNGGNSNPLNPNGNGGGVSTPIAIDPTGIPNDTGIGRGEWEGLTPDAGKFAAQTVYFDFDRAVIKPGEIEKIRVVAEHLKSNATHRVQVDGHCDERGTEEYNRSLGEKRAQAVREFLVREGVSPDRVRTVSYGEDKPADTGHGESAWNKNRRGEFILMTPARTL